MVGFLFGGETGDTPETLARKRKIAEALLANANRTPRNVGEAFGQGLTGIGEALLYRSLTKDIDKTEKANRTQGEADFAPLANTGFVSDANQSGVANELRKTSPTAEPAASSGDMSPYRSAIASIESAGSGDYAAVGPRHPKMGRALGRYQIMEANIGPWSQEALGRAVTPDEFMADPKLQDAIFDKKFGSYVDKFGPEGAAQAWFAGPGGVGKLDRKDSLGTSVAAYGRKFTNALGGSPAAAIEAAAPGSGTVAPEQTPAFDSGRFADDAVPAQGNEALVSALMASNVQQPYRDPIVSAPNAGSQASVQPELPPLPSRDVASLPVASLGQETASQPSPQHGKQVAQALAGAGQQNLPSDYFPAAPSAGGGPSQQQIIRALTSPYTSPEQKAVAKSMLERQQQASDPLRQLQLEQARLSVEKAKRPGYRVLSAEERKAIGIPDTDQRVYQIGPDNQIGAVGGAGQTINIGNEVDQRRTAAAQAGLKPEDPGYQGFILTGKLPKETEQPLTATDKKAIQEADEMVMNTEGVMPLLDRALELNDKAYSGPTAGLRGTIMGAVGNDAGLATQELDNVVTAGALQQLKAIFGGAPTEGERAILLDMSGASSKPPEVRKSIYERAKTLAQRRLDFYRQRANELRGGNYYRPAQEGTQKTAPTAPQGPSVDDLLKKYGG